MSSGNSKKEIKLKGVPSSAGISIGPVCVFQTHDYNFSVITAEDYEKELEKFKHAVEQKLNELKTIQKETEESYGKKMADLFSLQIGMLEDEILLKEIEDKIVEEKFVASYSIFQVLHNKKNYFLNLKNDYFRERAIEIQDLKQKLINLVENRARVTLQDKPSIIVAEDLAPTDTIKMHKKNVLGFVTEQGGVNSHAAIMGRALEIPSVAGCNGIMDLVNNGDMIIVDGLKGEIIVNPSDATLKHYEAEAEKYKSFEKQKIKRRLGKTFTKDKVRINIRANLDFTEELKIIKKYKSDGIGLYRTESLFMNRQALASENEQYEAYLKVAEFMYPEPVTIRTLDVGGDKVLPAIYHLSEQNPFLGWRAIRFCLDNEEIFLVQLKAILRANKLGNLKLMIPMISSYEEIIKTKQLLKKAEKQLNAEGKEYNADLKLGIMVEIPAAVVLGDIFADEVDFFSIGTNDLTQYSLAVDRGNQKIANLYSPFHPAVIRLIRDAIKVSNEKNIEIEMCGEMAGNPLAVPLLLGLGLRNFSMGHSIIPEIKHIVHSLSVEEAEKLAEKVLIIKTAKDIENYLRDYFEKKYPQLVFLQGETDEKSR